MSRKVAFYINGRLNKLILYNKTNDINNVDVKFRNYCRFL